MNYLYGELNKQAEIVLYSGSTSDTIRIDIDNKDHVISGHLIKKYFDFNIYTELPVANEDNYLTFAIVDGDGYLSLYICLKQNNSYAWKQLNISDLLGSFILGKSKLG